MRGRWSLKQLLIGFFLIYWILRPDLLVFANHRGSEGHHIVDTVEGEEGRGHSVPNAPFRVFWGKGKEMVEDLVITETQKEETIQTVIDAFMEMIAHRGEYQRFHEALTKKALNKVIIEPQVYNRDGKEFMFLVARTSKAGHVNLLINAGSIKEQGYLGQPDRLIPVLAREFQWVVSKADTTKKRQSGIGSRKLEAAPILSNKAIRTLSGAERIAALQLLFQDYLITVDTFESLKGQPYFELGTSNKIEPSQPDSTSKLYDIRVREALQHIVGDPYFLEHTPKAVRSLLNGKVWNVSFVDIASRDWATRTRVLPREKAVKVGQARRTIQPAKILVNVYRLASPDDPFYAETKNLSMGALSKEQLAKVIALEIEHNIIEKSMRGHTATDEQSN